MYCDYVDWFYLPGPFHYSMVAGKVSPWEGKEPQGLKKSEEKVKKEGLNGKAPAVSCEGSLVEIIY